jgi:hypothetical protein
MVAQAGSKLEIVAFEVVFVECQFGKIDVLQETTVFGGDGRTRSGAFFVNLLDIAGGGLVARRSSGEYLSS